LVRKAPGVVRHRSDLAMSFNNLGVAYCRAGRPADADDAFRRSRMLLSALADDYPDQLAYTSSLAALLNNQALALAEAGRLEESLQIYPAAIEAQRQCWQRLPHAVAMRQSLSKMYYNYGQTLRRVARYDDAVDAAIARRDMWPDNGQRLFGVAAELAETGKALRLDATATRDEGELQNLDNEIIKTLQLAKRHGWQGEPQLADDERFAFMKSNKQFVELIAKSDIKSDKGHRGATESTSQLK
jgi:tetratricopeptide (TPR) repeat protein